eukprot:TRINITY_DN764_c0_g1_i1.p1 TRINITY_DN764_c0_g1~~TRINITY_DN764_c0_g1_i1.p1  ORF type:complete len:279 (-),score=63.38 TRINITY_DN764_c0_g1_i1:344-1132(-)
MTGMLPPDAQRLAAAAICVSVFALILSRLISALKARSIRNKWDAECTRAKQERDNRTHKCLAGNDGGMPASGDEKIAAMTAMQLREAMHAGELTCEAVTMCFIRRSRRLGLLQLNAVTEELYDESLETAQALDRSERLLTTDLDDPDLPLLGLPVSIKDSIEQRGTMSTCGVACRLRLIYKEDGLLVSLMRTAGAIPYVRSNVPQLLMMSETDNRIFGRTLNPWSPLRGAGGSSGLHGFRVRPKILLSVSLIMSSCGTLERT